MRLEKSQCRIYTELLGEEKRIDRPFPSSLSVRGQSWLESHGTLHTTVHVSTFPKTSKNKKITGKLCVYNCCFWFCVASLGSKCNFWFVKHLMCVAFGCVATNCELKSLKFSLNRQIRKEVQWHGTQLFKRRFNTTFYIIDTLCLISDVFLYVGQRGCVGVCCCSVLCFHFG